MIAALLATVMVATSGGGGAAANDVVLEFADHLLDAGEPYRAAGEFERYLFLCGTCPRAPYAERRLAESFRRGGRAREAAARFAAVAKAHPDSVDGPLAARSAAESLEDASAPGEASDAYRAFLSRWPEHEAAGDSWDRALRTALRAHDHARVKGVLETDAPAGAPAVDEKALLEALETTRPKRRSPALAGTMSAILPGLGHAYAGRHRDAVMAFVVNALFISGTVIAIDHEQWALAGALGAAEIFWYGGSVVGAVNAADRFNRRAEDAHYRSLERRWVPAAGVSFRF